MIKGLFRLLVFVIIVVLIANYFWGNADERKASQEIAQQVKDLGKSIGDVLISEKGKIDDGKYDGAFEKVGEFIQKLRSNSDHMDVDDLNKINEFERSKNRLKKELEEAEADGELTDKEKEKFKAEWDQLIEEMEQFVEEQKKK